MSPSNRYHPFAIALHWLMAALIVALVVVGFTMDELPKGSAVRYAAINLHKLAGVVVLVLVAVRLAWRASHPMPSLDGLPTWQRVAAAISHRLLYALMIIMPASGLLFTNFGRGIRLFALELAPIGGANEALSDLFKDVHEAAASMLIALVAVHALAALWHHFGRRDGTLARMLPQVAGN